MPLLCSPAVATALESLDLLRALHEGPDGPIDLAQAYSCYPNGGGAPDDLALDDQDYPHLIFAAAHRGSNDVLRYIAEQLISIGKDPHAADSRGRTPLSVAAAEGHGPCIRVLVVELGADPNQANSSGATPCYIAARYGHDSCIRALVELGGDPNQAKNSGATPCHIAAQLGHDSCIRALVELGGDPNQAANDGVTPCIIAA